MDWSSPAPFARQGRHRPTRVSALVESLEPRALMADGITALPAFPIVAAPGVALTNVPVASFGVTSSSAPAGSSWRAQIDWGDGTTSDKKVAPVQNADGSFSFLGTHTYAKAGTFTITVKVAIPSSGNPNNNTVTTHAYVVQPSPLTLTGRSITATTRLPDMIGTTNSARLAASQAI